MHRQLFWIRFRIWTHRHGWMFAPVLFALTATVFGWLLFSPTFVDPDSFYHSRLSLQMAEQGIITEFPYLRYTILYDHFTDHHFLYHVLLIPFVSFLPMFVGAKVATVLIAAAFFTLWFLVARSLGGWLPSVAAILLLLTRPFDFRLGLTKAGGLALIVLFIGFWLVAKRKLGWLFVLSFFYAWTHGGFALLWIIAGLYGLAQVFLEPLPPDETVRHQQWKDRFQRLWVKPFAGAFYRGWHFVLIPTGIAILGGISGTILNPFFPNNLQFLWEQVIQIGLLNYQQTIGVGAEWYPFPIADLIPDISLMAMGLVVVLTLLFFHYRRSSALSIGTLLIAFFFLALTLKSRRYIEYAVPWGFLAITVNAGALEVRQLIELNWQRIRMYFSASTGRLVLAGLLAAYFVVMIPAIGIKGLINNKEIFAGGMQWSQWQGAAEWLAKHTPEGALVFHDDWDGFPILYALNPHNTYIVGLDPTFMFHYDPDRYWKFVNITTSKQTENLARIIGDDFGARYVFAGTDHVKLQNELRRNQDFVEVYRDDEASVFMIEE